MNAKFFQFCRKENIVITLFCLFVATSFLPLRHVLNFAFASRYGWFAEPLAISIYGADLVFASLVFVFLIAVRRFSHFDYFFWFAVVIFFLAEALRNSNFSLGIYSLVRLFQFFVFLLIAGRIIQHSFARTYLSLLIVWVGIFQTFLGFYQVIAGHSLGLRLLGEQILSITMAGVAKIDLGNGERLLRAYGTMPHPNILGGFFILSLAACLYLYRQNQMRRRMLAAGFAIIAFGLLLTFSRSAYLSAIILIVITLKSVSKSHLKPIIVTGTVVLFVFALVVAFVAPLRTGLLHRVVPPAADLFVTDRIILTSNGAAIFSNHLFFGVGLGNYFESLIAMAPVGSGLQNWQYDYPHNALAELLAELGIYGAIIFLFSIKKILRVYTRHNAIKYLFILLIISPLIIFDHYLWTNQIGRVILILFLTLLPFCILIKETKSNYKPPQGT